jgi:hypothetical protein
MALGFNFRASVFSTTAAASYATTGTYTPATGTLLVACVVGAGDNNDPNHATTPFTGHGVSWTKLTLAANDISTTHAISIWVADSGASPTSAACTAQWTTNRTGAAIIEYEITGADLTAGAVAAIVQNPTNTGTGLSGTLSLSAASASANRLLAFFAHLANQGTTPRTDWTEPVGSDGNFNNPATGVEGQYRDDAFETTASASWATSSAWRGVALEIAASVAVTLSLGVGSLAAAGLSAGSGFQGPSTGTIDALGYAPVISINTANTQIQIPAAAVVAEGRLVNPALGGGTTSVPAGNLTATGRAVGVGFEGPPTGTLTGAGAAPTVSIGSTGSGTAIQIPAGALVGSGTYVEILFLGPDTGTLAFTGHVPVAFAGIKPVPVGALVLTGQVLTIHTVVAVPVGALTLAGQAAAVLQPGPGIIGIPQGALALTGRTPSLSVIGDVTVAVPVGSVAFSGGAPAVGTTGQILRLVIGGVDQTLKLRVNTLNFTDELNARNTLTCELNDLDGTYHPVVGQEVILYALDGVTRLFAGTIDEPEEIAVLRRPTDTPVNIIRLTAVDFNQLADRKLAAEAYDNETFGNIVSDLITQYLAADGVTIGTVDAGPTFVRKVFNYRTIAECLNELSEDTGYNWWIDYDKSFHFRQREAITAPFSVSLSNSTIRRISVKTSRGAYRNRQYIRAGRDLTDVLLETFKGDGARQTFNVGFPIGETPSVLLNGVPQTVGIRGVDDDNAFQWYWNKDASEVSQRSAGVPPTLADSLVIAYRGLYPVLVQAQDDGLIADRIAVEGGSGLYEAIEDYRDIDDADLAFSTAVAKIQRYGLIRRTITFETDEDGLFSSQLLTVALPQHNIAEDFLIQSVRAQDVNGKFLRYSVSVIDGDAVGGWIAFYQRLTAARRESVQRDNELLLLLRSMPDVVTAGDSFSIDVPTAKETRIGLAQIGRSEVGVT